MTKKITDKVLRDLIWEAIGVYDSKETVLRKQAALKKFLEDYTKKNPNASVKDAYMAVKDGGLTYEGYSSPGGADEIPNAYKFTRSFVKGLVKPDGSSSASDGSSSSVSSPSSISSTDKEEVDEPDEVIPDEPDEIVVDKPDEPRTVPIATAMSNLSKTLPVNVFNNLKTALSKVVDLGKLMKLREDKSALEPADFEEFFSDFDDHKGLIKKNQEDNVVPDIRAAVIAAYNQVPNNQQSKQDLAAVLKYSQEIENIRATQGVTSGYSLNTSSGQAKGGKTPQMLNPEIAQAFDVAFQGSTLQARVKELQDFVNGLKSGTPAGTNISENYGQFIVLELLMKTLTTQEPSSAGTIFESFCAFMAFGGQAIGVDNGMEDFIWTQGETSHIGSAKMLKSGAGTSQNVDKMTKTGTKSSMTYVVGFKTTNGSPTTAGQIPDKIEFYMFDLFGRKGQTVQIGPVGATSGGTVLGMSDGRITMTNSVIMKHGGPTAILDLNGITLGNFDDHSEKIVSSINSDLSSMLDGFSNLKSNIDNYLLAIDNIEERKIYSEQAILEYGKLQELMTKSKIENLEESKKVNLKKLLESVFSIKEAKTGYSTLYTPGRDSFFDKNETETIKQKSNSKIQNNRDLGERNRSWFASNFSYSIINYKDVALSIFKYIFTYKDSENATASETIGGYADNWSVFVNGASGKLKDGKGTQQMTKRYLSSRSILKGTGALLPNYERALENALGKTYYALYKAEKGIKANKKDMKKLANQLISKFGNPNVMLDLDVRNPEVLEPNYFKGEDPGVDSGYEIGSRSGSEKKVDFQVLRAFENMFGKEGTFESKVAKLSQYIDNINKLMREDTTITEPIDNKFSGFIILDILSQLLYDQDATVAGWIFESFLAFMVGGTAIGSGYGAGDFVFSNGQQGSAKFLNDIQSSQNFEELPEFDKKRPIQTTIRYVFAVKSSVQSGKIEPTTKKTNTGLLEIYLADATKKGDEMTYTDPYTKNKNIATIEKNRANINVGGFEPKILDLTFMQELDFEKVSGKILEDINENVKACMINLDTSRNALNSYVMDKKQPSNLDKSVKSFNDIKKSLIPDNSKEIFGINESKNQTIITPNFLKKLISESFKK